MKKYSLFLIIVFLLCSLVSNAQSSEGQMTPEKREICFSLPGIIQILLEPRFLR